jgi:hypothetical protein
MLETTLAPAPDRATLERFDATLEEIRTLNRTAFLKYTLAIGDRLLDDWYDSDIRIYRDRRSTEHAVFETLMNARKDALEDLGLTAQTLRNYMLASCTWRELPVSVRERLDLTHLHRLSAVKDPIERARLAHDAAEDGLTSRELQKVIGDAKAAQQKGEKRGRKPLPKPVKAFGQVFAAVKAASKVREGLGELSEAQKKKVREQVTAVLAELQAVLLGLGE